MSLRSAGKRPHQLALLAFVSCSFACVDAPVTGAPPRDRPADDLRGPFAPAGRSKLPPSADGTLPPTSERATRTFPADDAALVYEGRFERSDPSRARCEWSGCAVVARFEGTGVSIQVGDAWGGNWLDVTIDGGDPQPVDLQAGDATVRIAEGLAFGPHVVRIVKRTEPLFGAWTFRGLVVDEALPLLPAEPRTRTVEVVGDSITAGYGDLGVGPDCSFEASTSSGRIAYGALAAAALNAAYSGVAWSGKGVYRNRDEGDPATMRDLYARTLPASAVTTGTPTPADVVVVNLGTNDFSYSVPPRAEFVSAVHELIDEVLAQNPSAYVIIALGPMLSDWYPEGLDMLTNARSYLQQVVDERLAQGDTAIRFLELPTDDGSLGYGCDWHPSAPRHNTMAGQLTTAIRNAVGW